MPTVEPDHDQFLAVVARVPDQTPVVMLNLLRFREVAEYDGTPGDCSGREAYTRRYGPAAFEHVTAAGGEVVWSGPAVGALIGPVEEEWDEVLLVRYPSIGAFVQMTSDPDYLDCARHRTAALLDSRLVVTLPGR